MDQDHQLSRLWRVYKTIHEMVADRGYLVSRTELEMKLDEFSSQYSTAGAIE